MDRKELLQEIDFNFKIHKAVILLGPRQVGKTTLAREYAKIHGINTENYFDLEDPVDKIRLENPKTTLSGLSGLVIIDEVQKMPELFEILRVLLDRDNNNIKVLLLGSASLELIKKTSETLAGRIGHIEVNPFAIYEAKNINKLWFRGGFPLSFLAESEELSYLWRKNFIATFLERDIPSFGFDISSVQLYKFWQLLTSYHGSVINYSALASKLNINYKTAQRYIDLLHDTFMIRMLKPWHENTQKRQVKSPKIYFKDSGIYHSLLGITNDSALKLSSNLGSSWEGFALEEIIRAGKYDKNECFFWGVQSQYELDLLIVRDGIKIGYEFKYNDAPKSTKSMKMAIDILDLKELNIIYPGDKNYKLDDKIFVKKLS